MNKHYIIVPLILLAGFLFVHRDAAKAWHERQAAHAAKLASEKLEAERQKEALARQAAAEAARRQAEREREERDRREQADREYAARCEKLQAALAAQRERVAALGQQFTAAEQRRRELIAANARLEADIFEAARQLELFRVQRRNAELEVERVSASVAARLHGALPIDGL